MRSYLELIEHWEQFLEEQPKGSLEDFAQWILERPTRASQAMAEDAAAVYEVSAAQVEKSYTIANAKAPYLLWRMSKILKVYNKPAFELEGLKSQDEFAILSFVQLLENIFPLMNTFCCISLFFISCILFCINSLVIMKHLTLFSL